jgi:hypothetical protein
MSKRFEVGLHWGAAVSILILGLLAVFPDSWHRAPIIGPPWSYIVGGLIGATLAGFHFWMLIECAFGGRWTARRVFWLVFLLLLPIAPAVIYFLFTRSQTFHSSISVNNTR